MNSLSDNVASAGSGGLNVELLESSFKMLAPRTQEFVGAFYERLFTAYPEIRRFLPIPTWGNSEKSRFRPWFSSWRTCTNRTL